MQLSVLRNFTLFLLLGTSLASADKITLASGEIIEGTIESETSDEYEILVKKGGIRDLKTFKKIEIKKIEKELPDQKPFSEIQKKYPLPIPDLLPQEKYEDAIQTDLKPFITKFPKSRHLDEVKKILAQYTEELEKIKAGDKKIENKWIAAAEWNADAIENDALLALKEMERRANAKSFRGAMIQFDKIQTQYPGTRAAISANEVAAKILPTYQRIVTSKTLAAKDKLEQQLEAFEKLGNRDARRAKAAFEERMAAHEERIESEREARNKWIPMNDFDHKNLRRLGSHITSTLRKLERGSKSRKNVGELYRQAWALASVGDEKKLKRALGKLKSAGADEKYFALLQTQLEENPAPKMVETKPEPKIENPPKEQPKKDKKDRKKKEKDQKPKKDRPAEPEEEVEKSSVIPIIGIIAVLSLVGLFVGISQKKKKK